MKTEIENLSASRIVLSCTIEAEEKLVLYNKIVQKFCAARALPGFRKGKVPRPKIEQVFANEILMETINEAVTTYYKKACVEQKLNVFELVEIFDVEPDGTGEIAFKARIDLIPTFTLPDTTHIPVDNQDTVVTESDVDEEIRKLCAGMASFEDFTPDSVAAQDDMLSIDYVGTLDGQPLEAVVPDAAVFAKKENAWCTVGSTYHLIPGLPSELEGKKIGETGTISVEFPADFMKESLRGRTVDYTYTVKEGRHMVVPQVDAALLEKINMESEEALRTRIREHLEQQARETDKSRRTNQVIDHMLKETPFEVPQAELERQTESTLNRFLQHAMRQGLSKEDLAAERESLSERARESAIAQLRLDFISNRIAEEENIEFPLHEFNAFLTQLFISQRLPKQQINAILKDPARIQRLRQEGLKCKVMDTLVSRAQPSETVSI